MNTIVLEVPGINCSSCVRKVTDAIKALPGVSTMEIDLVTRRVRVRGDFTQDSAPLLSALKHAGYPAHEAGTGTPLLAGDGHRRCCSE